MRKIIDNDNALKKVIMSSVLHICQFYVGSHTELESEGNDIDHLWRVIQAHKLQAAFYEVSQRTNLNLANSLLNKLEVRSKKTLLRKLFYIKEIISIQAAHKNEGIYVIPYKGLAIGAFSIRIFTREIL